MCMVAICGKWYAYDVILQGTVCSNLFTMWMNGPSAHLQSGSGHKCHHIYLDVFAFVQYFLHAKPGLRATRSLHFPSLSLSVPRGAWLSWIEVSPSVWSTTTCAILVSKIQRYQSRALHKCSTAHRKFQGVVPSCANSSKYSALIICLTKQARIFDWKALFYQHPRGSYLNNAELFKFFCQEQGSWGKFTVCCGEVTLEFVCIGAVGDEVWLPDDDVQSRALHPPQPAHGLRAYQAAEGPRWGFPFLFYLTHTWPPTGCHTAPHPAPPRLTSPTCLHPHLC